MDLNLIITIVISKVIGDAVWYLIQLWVTNSKWFTKWIMKTIMKISEQVEEI